MGKRGKTNTPKCKQCGDCCIISTADGWKDCKYLIRYITGEGVREPATRCLIFMHRLYAIIGKNQYCHKREHSNYNFPNCPFNKDGQALHPKYLSEKQN